MTKSTKVLIIVLAAVLLIAVLFCCAASAFAYLNTQKIMTALDESGEEEPTREDDVCIAEEYYIRSTTPISDAYTSGDVSALDDRQKEVLKMAETVIKEVVEDDMTPYEKEEAIYRWLTSELKSETGMLTVIPDSGEDSDNPYGVLKYHTAVCVGYATTFRMFMHMLGIECMVVHDTSLTHSWDLVKLDGDWYHVDCYFDSDQSNYRHFNLSDAIMIEDHDWDRAFFPKAEGYKYNAAAQNAETVKSVYDIPAFVKAKLDDGEATFACRVEGGIPASEQPAASYIANAVSDTVMSAYENRELQFYWADMGNDDFVLCMFVNAYGEDVTDLPEDVAEKVQKAMEDAFGDMYMGGFDPSFDEDDAFMTGTVGGRIGG